MSRSSVFLRFGPARLGVLARKARPGRLDRPARLGRPTRLVAGLVVAGLVAVGCTSDAAPGTSDSSAATTSVADPSIRNAAGTDSTEPGSSETGSSETGSSVAGATADETSRMVTPDHSFLGRPVTSGFRPEIHGFSFPNFADTRYLESFGMEDLLEVVGSGPRVCVDGVASPCVLTEEASGFVDLVNDARRAGHCEGMVILAAVRFDRAMEPETSRLDPEPHVIDAIIRAFATIFLPEVQAEVRFWESESLADTVAVLAASLHEDSLEYGMGIYLHNGGHEVLPYAIEYPEPNLARVWVYDSNWPLQERFVDIDLETETWTFSFAGDDPAADPHAWTGGHEDLDLNSVYHRIEALQARGIDMSS